MSDMARQPSTFIVRVEALIDSSKARFLIRGAYRFFVMFRTKETKGSHLPPPPRFEDHETKKKNAGTAECYLRARRVQRFWLSDKRATQKPRRLHCVLSPYVGLVETEPTLK